MSGPDRPEPVAGSDDDPDPTAETGSGQPGPARPGAATFTIEGRAAPALFVVAWLATILGAVATFAGFMAAPSPAKAILLVAGLFLVGFGLLAGAGSQAMERRARGATFSGPSPFLAFTASVPIAIGLTYLAAFPLALLGFEVETPLVSLVSVLLTGLVYYAIVRILVVDHGALTWSDMGVRPTDRSAVLLFVDGALYAVPAILATGVVAAIASGFLPPPPSPLPDASDALGVVANLAAAAIVAPIAEELFFRAYATTAWERVYGPRRAIVQGAIFFAFVHILGVTGASAGEAAGAAVTAFIARLPIAFMLGWIFLRRGSLWSSIGLHSVFNLLLVLVALGAGQI